MSVRITSSPLGISLGRVAAYAEEHRQLEPAIRPEHGRQRVRRCNDALAAAAANDARRFAIGEVVPWALVLEFVPLEDVRPVSTAARFLYAITSSAPFWGVQVRRGRFELANKHLAAQGQELDDIAADGVDAEAPALGDIGRGLPTGPIDVAAAKLNLLRFFDPYAAPASLVQLALATHEDVVDPSSANLVPPQRLRFFEEVMPLLDRARDAKAEGLKRVLANRRTTTKRLVGCWALCFVSLLGGTGLAFVLRTMRDATAPTVLYFLVCLAVIVVTMVVILKALRWPSTRLFYFQRRLAPSAAFFDTGASHAVWCGVGTLLCLLVSAYAFSALDAYAELYLFLDDMPTTRAECHRPHNVTLRANRGAWPAYVEVDTNQWSWALDDVHAPYGLEIDARVPLTTTDTDPAISYYLLRPLGPLVAPPWCGDAGDVVSARDSPALAVRAAARNATLALLGLRQGAGAVFSMRTVVAGARHGTGLGRVEDAWRAGQAWQVYGIPLLSGDAGVVERGDSLRLFVLAAAVDVAVFGCSLAVFAVFTLAGFRRDRRLFESVRNSRLRKHNPLSTSAASYASPAGSAVFGSGQGGTLVLEDFSPPQEKLSTEGAPAHEEVSAPLHRILSASYIPQNPSGNGDNDGAAAAAPPPSIQRRRRSTLAPPLDEEAVALRREASAAAVVAEAPLGVSQHDPYGTTPKLLVPFGMTPHVQQQPRPQAMAAKGAADAVAGEAASSPTSPSAGELPRRPTKAFRSPGSGGAGLQEDAGDGGVPQRTFFTPSPRLPVMAADDGYGGAVEAHEDGASPQVGTGLDPEGFDPPSPSERSARMSLGSADGLDDPVFGEAPLPPPPTTTAQAHSRHVGVVPLRLGSLSPAASPLRRRGAPFGMTPMVRQPGEAGSRQPPTGPTTDYATDHRASAGLAPEARVGTPDASLLDAVSGGADDERTFASAAGDDSHIDGDDDHGDFGI